MTLQDGSEELVAQQPEAAAKKRRGLSPFMLFTNKMLAAAKASKGGTLSLEQVGEVRRQARSTWDSLEDRSAFEGLYQAWQEKPRTEAAERAAHAFKPAWGGGCNATPISASELHEHYCNKGWPTHDEVHNAKPSYIQADPTVDWSASKGVDLFGCDRSPLGVCRKDLECTSGFSVVHAGLCNVLELIPKTEVHGGQVMLLAEGTKKAGDGETLRWAFMITGVCWSPKVFDATMLLFRNAALETASSLPVPFDLGISQRASKVSDNFLCIAVEASGALARRMAQECSHITLYRPSYKILLGDGTLTWSRVTSLNKCGNLLAPGLNRPLFAEEVTAHRKLERAGRAGQPLRQGDPLAPAKPFELRPRRPPVGNQGRGRGRRAHGGGDGPQAPETGARPATSVVRPGAVEHARAAAPPLAFGSSGGGPGQASDAPAGAAELAPPLLDDDLFDMFDIEGELGHMVDDDLEELQLTYGQEMPAASSNIEVSVDIDDVGGTPTSVLQGLAAMAHEQAEKSGLAGGEDGGQHVADGGESEAQVAGGGASGSNADEFEQQQPLAEAPPPEFAGPTPMGYVSRNGRSFIRIQRGNLKNSLSVKCYQHSNCSFVLPLRLAPSDEALIAWGQAVPPSQRGDTNEAKKEAAKRHMSLARQFREAAASAGDGGAQSSSSRAPCV